MPKVVERDGQRAETFPNARQPDWPEAEFIVGNPPFIGNKRMNSVLGLGYVKQLRLIWPEVSEAADFVMYWWSKAAELSGKSKVRRFGLVTTNSITMSFNRSVVEKHLSAKWPISIAYAVADHPWMVGEGGAAVRVAMTVVEKGLREGWVQSVKNPKSGFADSDDLQAPVRGFINGFLRTGAKLTNAKPILSNAGLSFMGVIPVSLRFVLSESEQKLFDVNRKDYAAILKNYLGGKDLSENRKTRLIIDFFNLSESEARQKFPRAYQHVMEFVKPFRDNVARKNHRDNWWIFGEARPGMRAALAGLDYFIATTETSKHRWFTKLPATILPDQKIRVIASDSNLLLAELSSRFHVLWANAIGGRVGKGNDPVYNGTICFDPFPFPDPSQDLRDRLGEVGRELDMLRKRVMTEHSDLTFTALYNVLEKLKAGERLSDKDQDVKQRGLVLILKDLHESIDRLVAEAYGWPADLSDDQVLERLVSLNAERAREEAVGQVRWLRPEYQIPRFAKGAVAKTAELDIGETVVAIDESKPVFPKDRYEQPLAVEALLSASAVTLDAAAISRAFKGGGKKIEPRVSQVLLTLARYGRVTRLPDGKFAARKVA